MTIYTRESAIEEILHLKEKYNRYSPQIKKNKDLFKWINEEINKTHPICNNDILSAKVFLLLNSDFKVICPYGNKKNYSITMKKYACSNSCQCTKDLCSDTYFQKTSYKNPMENPEVIIKQKDNYFGKTGYDNPSKNPLVKQQKIDTCLKNNGVEYPSQSKEIRDKSKNTWIENWKFDNPSKSPKIKERKVNTCLENYGYEYSGQCPKVQEKSKFTNQQLYKVSYYSQRNIPKESLLILDNKEQFNKLIEEYSFESITNILKVSYKTVLRRYRKHNPDKPLMKGMSSYEIEIANWLINENIKFLPKNRTILQNIMKVKNSKSKELDFYFPDYNFAIEFQGTYWHMDPRKYQATDYNKGAKKTAQELWDKDKYKADLCKSLNVDLIVIWQQDWINNKDEIKDIRKTSC